MAFQSWYVITGPKGMDRAIVKELSGALSEAMKAPEYVKLAKELKSIPQTAMGDELRNALMPRDSRYAELLKKLGMGMK